MHFVHFKTFLLLFFQNKRKAICVNAADIHLDVQCTQLQFSAQALSQKLILYFKHFRL